MAVKDRDARLGLERAIQNAVEVSAVHRNVAVEIAIAVFREDDVTEDSRIAVKPVGRAPQREASFLLHSTAPQAAQQMIRELAVQHFAQNDAVPQRALQILRMCPSR